jgi:hypothetical protein
MWFVEEVFAESWMNGPGLNNWGPYPTAALPRPDNFDDDGGRIPFHRMSVAYGLAHPIPEWGIDAGGYVLPDDCPDNTPPRLERVILSRNDVDEVYPHTPTRCCCVTARYLYGTSSWVGRTVSSGPG